MLEFWCQLSDPVLTRFRNLTPDDLNASCFLSQQQLTNSIFLGNHLDLDITLISSKHVHCTNMSFSAGALGFTFCICWTRAYVARNFVLKLVPLKLQLYFKIDLFKRKFHIMILIVQGALCVPQWCHQQKFSNSW